MDITYFIKKAVNLDVNWKYDHFHSIVSELSKFFNVNYEPEVEKIAIVEIENNIVGYIYADYPIFFIEDTYLSKIKAILHKDEYIQYVTVDFFNHEYLSVDKALYEKYFNYMDDLNNFSVLDFYFYNIT
ncbi:MAG: hypothetical protein MUW56_15020 [Chryseobacterium sp.]|uniref:hypothetical protein n=1 Tax=Chryseobacterium sp. TaxID=1871047 RepID=UPI0025B9515C|nr:hypothetical protein [Chryseobacterium sp.]MCJ7934888.1 hypothetical protein [Chryseobacterium sp.]